LSNFKISRSRVNVLPIAIGITLLLAVFPASWLRWTSDIADLVRVPVTPVSHIGTLVTSWVRSPADVPGMIEDEVERNALAEMERDHFRQLHAAQMLRATELADQLRILQNLPESALRNPQPPLIIPIDITGKQLQKVSGTIELKLISGASERIQVGDIAVVGKDIVGRVARIGSTRIELHPITHKETGLTRAAILPARPQQGRAPLLAEIILQSDGSASMYADVPATSGVQKFDLVVLDDPSWPSVAAGFTVGIVESVLQLDEAPLRQRVVITPRRTARDVARVVVLGTGESAK
jgi:hypothetical protein